MSGRSAAWLARLVRDQEVEGSNPFAPTIFSQPFPFILYAGLDSDAVPAHLHSLRPQVRSIDAPWAITRALFRV